MDILFVNSLISSLYENVFPVGLVSLCTVLKSNNYSCDIVDFSQLYHTYALDIKDEGDLISSFVEYILSLTPKVISFYTMSNSYEFSITVAQKIKEISPQIFIVFAGPQASACAKETIESLSFVDLVAIGEGELTILKLLENIQNGDFSESPNICYRRGNEILINTECDLVADLDDLPMLDYSFVKNIKKFDSIPIEAGRGCPFSCTFCSTKSFWKQKYRLKSVSRIIEEMKFLFRQYGINKFNLEHDSLTANKKQITDLCDVLIDEQVNFTWGCSSRVDVLDDLLINKLYDAGCRSMFLGIESGSPRIQNSIHKNLSIKKIREIIPLLNRKGISIRCSFMYDFPDETQDDIEQTLNLIEYLVSEGIVDISIYKLTVLHGTELYFTYKDRLRLMKIEETSYFTFGYDGSQYNSVILQYPKLFPQYCRIDIDRLFDTSYIESFVNYFIVIWCSKLKTSYKYLRFKYKSSYDLYLRMKECCSQIEKLAIRLLSKKIEASLFEKKIIDSFINYIKKNYCEDDKNILCAFLQFDTDIINFTSTSEESALSNYICDIKAFVNHNKIILKNTAVTLFRRNGKVYMK